MSNLKEKTELLNKLKKHTPIAKGQNDLVVPAYLAPSFIGDLTTGLENFGNNIWNYISKAAKAIPEVFVGSRSATLPGMLLYSLPAGKGSTLTEREMIPEEAYREIYGTFRGKPWQPNYETYPGNISEAYRNGAYGPFPIEGITVLPSHEIVSRYMPELSVVMLDEEPVTVEENKEETKEPEVIITEEPEEPEEEPEEPEEEPEEVSKKTEGPFEITEYADGSIKVSGKGKYFLNLKKGEKYSIDKEGNIEIRNKFSPNEYYDKDLNTIHKEQFNKRTESVPKSNGSESTPKSNGSDFTPSSTNSKSWGDYGKWNWRTSLHNGNFLWNPTTPGFWGYNGTIEGLRTISNFRNHTYNDTNSDPFENFIKNVTKNAKSGPMRVGQYFSPSRIVGNMLYSTGKWITGPGNGEQEDEKFIDTREDSEKVAKSVNESLTSLSWENDSTSIKDDNKNKQ